MTDAWAIKEWDKWFERSESRRYEMSRYVPIRNDHNATAFRMLMQFPSGQAAFGLFIAAVQIASRCPVRGVLTTSDRPLSDEAISMKIGCKAKHWEQAAKLLASEDIQWLYRAPWPVRTPGTPREDSERAPGGLGVVPSIQEEKREEKKKPPLPPQGGSAQFRDFWAMWPKHPRKANRAGCWRVWHRRGLDLIADMILASLARWKASREWSKQGGDFIPAPLVWLNQARWEVESIPRAESDGEIPDVTPTHEEVQAILREPAP